MEKAIDAEKYMALLKEQYLHNKSMGNSQVAKAWQGAMQLLYDMPTITLSNEPLTCEGCKFEYETTDEAMCEQCIRSPAYRDHYRRPPEGEGNA